MAQPFLAMYGLCPSAWEGAKQIRQTVDAPLPIALLPPGRHALAPHPLFAVNSTDSPGWTSPIPCEGQLELV